MGHRLGSPYANRPATGRRLRQVLLALLSLWIITALVDFIWLQLPEPQPDTLNGQLINPLTRSGTGSDSQESVDIEALRSWPLFGEPGTTGAAEQTIVAASLVENERDGIEAGARESRLDLTLRGIVASTADGLGSAIIENRGQQDVYAVDDPLPVSGRVTLAKVMPSQVVINNSGTFELLTLYDASDFDAQVQAQRAVQPGAGEQGLRSPQRVDKRGDPTATELASNYREQLYQNPQSLAELVRISAVRQDGQLRGYQIVPGRDQEQFKRLGFRSGDLVIAVNGMPLSDPGNTMRLYQTMRSATEASFDLLREGQSVSLSVSLGAAASDQ
ncbi:type II secretion system protein GspC [Kineobactrum sediminis]|uniref:Type II secretion system protein GspC n=1 Tax=Kineobactrum sediminis TaxID=1905677 RepID=A0A2N5Y100_9GAMM|nr:type II secretion system protein GspC [Kineobactrum sediminis]